MTTDTKFKVVVSPEADEALDALPNDETGVLIETLAFIAGELPNIVRRSAVSKATTPFGTIFVFQVPETNVVVTALNGRTQENERAMIVIGVGAVEV